MPHTLTPAQEHVQRVLAEQSQPQTTESTNGTLLMQLVGDKRELGAIQSIEARIARKHEFLPKYAGNLDIMTSAAARTAEMFAHEIVEGRITLKPVPAEEAA